MYLFIFVTYSTKCTHTDQSLQSESERVLLLRRQACLAMSVAFRCDIFEASSDLLDRCGKGGLVKLPSVARLNDIGLRDTLCESGVWNETGCSTGCDLNDSRKSKQNLIETAQN